MGCQIGITAQLHHGYLLFKTRKSFRMLPGAFSALVAGHETCASHTTRVRLHHSSLKFPLHSHTHSFSQSVITVILNRHISTHIPQLGLLYISSKKECRSIRLLGTSCAAALPNNMLAMMGQRTCIHQLTPYFLQATHKHAYEFLHAAMDTRPRALLSMMQHIPAYDYSGMKGNRNICFENED